LTTWNPILKSLVACYFSVNPSLGGQSSWVLLLPEVMVNLTRVIVKNFQLEIALRKQQIIIPLEKLPTYTSTFEYGHWSQTNRTEPT
jgi:hypothetical protein